MATIRVKITDSTQPEPWFASAWTKDKETPEACVRRLNRAAKVVSHIGKVSYELATEAEYLEYRNQMRS